LLSSAAYPVKRRIPHRLFELVVAISRLRLNPNKAPINIINIMKIVPADYTIADVETKAAEHSPAQ
jgi:hypothetical protein